MKLCTNFHNFISRIDGTRDDQTSACFRDSFGNLISVSVFKRTIINVSLAKNLTETLSVSIPGIAVSVVVMIVIWTPYNH